jgi:hypothetical protein
VMRDAFGEAHKLAIGTNDYDAEPIVGALDEGVAPLPLANGAGGTRTAMRLDESGHVELSEGGHVRRSGSAKLKVARSHRD